MPFLRVKFDLTRYSKVTIFGWIYIMDDSDGGGH